MWDQSGYKRVFHIDNGVFVLHAIPTGNRVKNPKIEDENTSIEVSEVCTQSISNQTGKHIDRGV